MTGQRESFLQRVREAVSAGNRAGIAGAIEARNNLGYQGAGRDPVGRFCAELTALGGHPHVIANQEAARATVIEILQSSSARKILLGSGPYLDGLNLAEALSNTGLEVARVDALAAAACQEPFFAADVGISGVEYLIAETGTMVMAARPQDPRSLSLLPPVHIAVAERRQLLADLFDLFAIYAPQETSEVLNDFGSFGCRLPSCLSLITGPSKTGDIELRLVTGVHGPGEIHVILLSS